LPTISFNAWAIILFMNKKISLLGDLSINEFLREYWQKKPLLIRQAIPEFTGLLNPKQLIELACDADAQARLVNHKRGKWHLHHGPFDAADFTALGKTAWSILVQGVNHTLPQAADLLKRFSFIPHTRLDDLMVSYAPKGGGVGPHFDSYDVFLLQGSGHRRWQISAQHDRTLIADAPLRILQNFTPEHEWVLNPGDMLYLPPHWAHNGIAEDECMTYSIGFRTPSYQELGEQFLVYLQDNLSIDGMYADPDIKAQDHPSEISTQMLGQVAAAIKKITWDKSDIASFLGCYLSEPKPHIFFDPPEKPWTLKRFRQAIKSGGIALDLKTQILCQGSDIYINGEAYQVDADTYPILRALADSRQLQADNVPDEAGTLMYQWYLDGYLVPVTD